MKERPILFSGPMVSVLLAGTKTQTRRVCKPQPTVKASPLAGERGVGYFAIEEGPGTVRMMGAANYASEFCPYGKPGDRLWVRETFAVKWRESLDEPWEGFAYRADHPEGEPVPGGKWKPSIFMPRVASRLTLEIVSVRLKQLQKISGFDALAEGYPDEMPTCDLLHYGGGRKCRDWYARLWDKINGAGAWDVNPWVWVIAFKRVEQDAPQ